jgi:hypothetical protein
MKCAQKVEEGGGGELIAGRDQGNSIQRKKTCFERSN